MTKLLLSGIILLFISCGYRKRVDIGKDYGEYESFYTVRIFAPSFTNCPPIQQYYLPMDGITDKKVDSVNKLADKYIENCEKYN